MAESVKIFLEISRDGGCTWETAKQRDLSVADKPRHRIMWRRNGRFDTTVIFRFSTQESAVFAVDQLTAEIIPGE